MFSVYAVLVYFLLLAVGLLVMRQRGGSRQVGRKPLDGCDDTLVLYNLRENIA